MLFCRRQAQIHPPVNNAKYHEYHCDTQHRPGIGKVTRWIARCFLWFVNIQPYTITNS
jgi:hypothetical protein